MLSTQIKDTGDQVAWNILQIKVHIAGDIAQDLCQYFTKHSSITINKAGTRWFAHLKIPHYNYIQKCKCQGCN